MKKGKCWLPQTEHRNEFVPFIPTGWEQIKPLSVTGLCHARQVLDGWTTSLAFSSFIFRQALKTKWLLLNMKSSYLNLWIAETLCTTRSGFQAHHSWYYLRFIFIASIWRQRILGPWQGTGRTEESECEHNYGFSFSYNPSCNTPYAASTWNKLSQVCVEDSEMKRTSFWVPIATEAILQNEICIMWQKMAYSFHLTNLIHSFIHSWQGFSV